MFRGVVGRPAIFRPVSRSVLRPMICWLMVFKPTIFQPFIFLRVDAHRLPVVFVRVRSEQAVRLGLSAFSSEVDTGSREENALFKKTRRVFPIQRIGKRYGVTPP
jgi:hypothetical protein